MADGGSRGVWQVVRFVAPRRLRNRWQACLVVGIVFGLTLGLGLFALAGARRTQSSYDRFLGSVGSSDVSISQGGFVPSDNAHVAVLPGVSRSRTYLGVRAVVSVDDVPDVAQFFEGVVSFDGAFFDQDRFVATRGRAPDPNRQDEIAVNDVAADRYGYRVGQLLDIGLVDLATLDGPTGSTASSTTLTHRTTMTIVGIGVFPDEVMQDDADRTPRTLFTPAFAAVAGDAAFYNLQYVRLSDRNAALPAIRAYLDEVAPPGSVDVHDISVDRAHARRGLRPLSIALAVFGLVVCAVASALGIVALIRLQRRDADDATVLSALGASPAAIRSAALVAPTSTLVVACLVAGVAAALLSPFMPLGPAHGLGGGTGFDIDVATIGVGLLIVAVVSSAGIAVSSRRATSTTDRRATRRRRSHLAQGVANAGAPPTLTTGIRMTVDDGVARGGVPMRFLIGGTAVAVVTLVVALGFATNLSELTQHPAQYGWNWDAALRAGQGFGNLDSTRTSSILAADDDVAAWSSVYLGDDLLDGTDVPLLGMSPSADVRPPVVDGRFIAGPDEIVLGAATASTLHASIGSTVAIGGSGPSRSLRVVGIVVLPSIGAQHVQHPSLGLGAVVVPQLIPGVDPSSASGPQLALVRFRSGVDEATATQRLATLVEPLGDVAELDVLGVQRPAEIVNTASLGSTPLLVAALLAGVAALALGLALGASVRRNARDLAVLRTLGFVDRQMVSTVAWHAYTTIGAGLVVGLPLGVIASSWVWRAFADELDVVATNRTPLAAVVLVGAGALAIVTAVAVAPAFAARRLTPATILHSP